MEREIRLEVDPADIADLQIGDLLDVRLKGKVRTLGDGAAPFGDDKLDIPPTPAFVTLMIEKQIFSRSGNANKVAVTSEREDGE